MKEFHQLRSTLKRTVAPTVEPVSVASLKQHSRLGDVADEDLVLTKYLLAAREMVETDTQRALCTQTWQLQMGQFPCGGVNGYDFPFINAIELRICPVASVSSIYYVASDGTSTLWPSSNYIVNTSSEPGRVTLAYGATWPTVRNQENAVTVTFVSGYGAATDVPERACQAIRLLAAEWVISREAGGAIVDEKLVNYRSVIDRLLWSGYR